VRGLRDGVAAVQGLEPEELVRGGGPPGDLPRSERDPVNGDLVSHGKRGDGGHERALAVPHLDRAGEAPPGHRVRPGREETLHEKVAPVRRELGGGVDRGRAHRLPLAGLRLDDDQLGGRVVGEEGVVVGGLEQVAGLVGGACRGALALLDPWPRRDGGRRRRRAPLGDAAHQEAPLVGEPGGCRAEERVDPHVDLLQVAGHGAHPQAHVIGVTDREGEAPAVGGPVHVVDLGALGQGQADLGAALDRHQPRRGGPVPPVDGADQGVHPDAGELVHRPR
jgi:hypothetical protein